MTTLPNGRQEAPTDKEGALDFRDGLPFPATVVAIHAISPEGYPITLTLNDPAQGAMKSWIALLQKQGFTAPNQTVNPTSGAATPTTAKVCPYHGPMKESDKRPGTFYCPKKMADGSYCKEKG